jgi:Predicted thioesterase
MNQFNWPVRIYWEATDAAGMVYHGAYPGIFEQARVEWMRALGFGQARQDGMVQGFFAVTKLDIDYVRPVLLDHEVSVTCSVSASGASRLILAQNIWHQTNSWPTQWCHWLGLMRQINDQRECPRN